MKRVVFLVVWLSAFAHIPATAQSMSNEALIDSLFLKALDSIRVSHYFDSSGLQIVLSALNPEKQAYCRNVLIQYFNRKGIPVFQEARKARLAVEVFDVKIEYREPTGEILGFGGKVQRRVRLRLNGWISPADSRQGNRALKVQITRNDWIKRSRIDDLEASPFSFVQGQWVSYSRWTRYLQPAVVLGSVSVLIYLFFSLRS